MNRLGTVLAYGPVTPESLRGGLCNDPARVPFTTDMHISLGGYEQALVFVRCGDTAEQVGRRVIRAMHGEDPHREPAVDYSLEKELGA